MPTKAQNIFEKPGFMDTNDTTVRDSFLLSILGTTASLRQQTFELLLVKNLAAEDLSGTQSVQYSTILKLLATHLSRLRGQNRHLAHVVHATKAQTGISRAEVDRLHLSLQNLYYEQRHLQGEISACEDFPHSFKQLPLISKYEYLAKFPNWKAETLQATESETNHPESDDNEGLMKARIQDEHDERKKLEEQRQKLVHRKLELSRENAKRKEELVNLDKDLEAFIEVGPLVLRHSLLL